MKRVAYFSPLPPDRSGIADYSAELLPDLAAHCRLEVFAPRHRRARRALAIDLPVRPVSGFERAAAARPYDALVYQLGNVWRYHGEIYRTLVRHPGIVVLHEFMLHDMMRELALERRGAQAFTEEMRYCYGQGGARLAERLLAGEIAIDRWRFPLFERAVDCALGVITHSRAVRDRLWVSRPKVRVAVVPHHVSLHRQDLATERERAAARVSLGLSEDTLLLASFGHLTPAKRLDRALRAFARLRREHPSAAFVLVGEIPRAYAALSELLRGELGAGVVVTGRASLDRFLELMACCDIAVNLRHPTGGETSGSCIRLLGLGRPVVVTDTGWFSEIPDDCCAKVALGPAEDEHLLALLRTLASSAELRRAMGRNARRWVLGSHRLEDSARGYADFIDEIVETAPEPYRPVPPLASHPPADVFSILVADLAGDVAELGVADAEEALLRDLSRTLVDLNLDRALSLSGPKGRRS